MSQKQIVEMLQAISVQSILAVTVVVGGLWIIAFEDIGERTEGLLGGMIILILGYYFGSSKGSAKKDQTIADISEKK